MSGPRRIDPLFRGLSPKSLRAYLDCEGALPHPSMDESERRQARRKYRKLQRLAEKREICLDRLLVNRSGDRRHERARETIGTQQALYMEGCSYFMTVMGEERQKVPGTEHNYPYTRPVFRVRIDGIMRWSDPATTPLPSGTELQVHRKQISPLPFRLKHGPLSSIEACRFNIYACKDNEMSHHKDSVGEWEAVLEDLTRARDSDAP